MLIALGSKARARRSGSLHDVQIKRGHRAYTVCCQHGHLVSLQVDTMEKLVNLTRKPAKRGAIRDEPSMRYAVALVLKGDMGWWVSAM